MTTTTTKRIIAGAIILLIALVIFLLLKQCNIPKPEISVTRDDSTQYYKNKLGQEVAALKMERDEYGKTLTIQFRDSIAKLHNTIDKKVKEITILRQKGTVIIDNTKPPIVKIDTVPGVEQEYLSVEQNFDNSYYHANAFISLSGGTSTMKLQTFDTLSVVAKVVTEGRIFHRKSYLQVDAINANPYNKIEGLNVYRQPLPKQKKIGIGPQVGYGFSQSFKPSVYVGIGIHYSLIRL